MRIRFSFVLLFLLVALLACDSSPSSQLEKNKEIMHRFVEAINGRSYDVLAEYVAPEFVRHCHATPDVQVRSLDDLKQFLRQDLKVFPDSRITMKMSIAEGDMVAGYLSYEGTQEGAIGTFPASGKRVAVDFIAFARIDDGRIAEMWVEWDNLAILSQLGHWPPKGVIDQ